MKKINEFNIKTSKTILSNTRLLGITFGNNNKIFDLCLFVNSSLDKACNDFKVVNKKSTFDHSKMKSWEDVEKYRYEVLPYMKLDVLALKELFEKFNSMMYDMCEANINNYMTLSQMGYSVWCSLINKDDIDSQIEIPNDMKRYNFIKQATYGGRCYPMEQKYKSKHFERVCKGKMSYKKLLKSGKFIFNADATGLYPASMKGFELCAVKYPMGKSRWSKNGKKEFDDKKIGLYDIEFQCPKNITVRYYQEKS
jgi:hypothetical protein